MSFILALLTAVIGTVPLLFSKERNALRLAPWFAGAVLLVSWGCYYSTVPSLVWPMWGGVGAGVLLAWVAAGIFTTMTQYDYRSESNIRKVVFPAVLALLFLFRGCSGCSALRADDYAALLGNVEQRTWTEDVQPTNPEHVRLVPPELAYYLAQKQLGEAPGAIGSQFSIAFEHGTLQRIGGELWYIFPLDFNGFKVWSSSDGSPGYVKVHGEDPLRQPIVKADERFVYTPGAYFGDNLKRHLWKHWMNYGLTDYSLEVDEEGKAWWVVTVFKPTIAWSGKIVEGVLIVNPTTGDETYHMVERIPPWVDRIIPGDFVHDYITYRGKYANGWWNNVWANKDITEPDEPDIVYGSDGEPYWVTGVTSANRDDDSLLSVMYTSTRTGKTVSYKVDGGGTDAAALEAINNKVAFKKWHAGAVVPYNLYGTMAAVAPLLGENHTFQGVGIVNIRTMQVALGDNAAEAFRDYQKLLAGAGNTLAPDMAHLRRDEVGTVERFASHIDGNGTVYYLVAAGSPHIFTGAAELSSKLPVTRVGDSVSLAYIESTEVVVPMLAFDNQSLFMPAGAAVPQQEPAQAPAQ